MSKLSQEREKTQDSFLNLDFKTNTIDKILNPHHNTVKNNMTKQEEIKGETGHSIDWENTTLLHKKDNFWKRKIRKKV